MHVVMLDIVSNCVQTGTCAICMNKFTAQPLDISANCYRILFKLYDCVYC